ncbi:hypothetical protein BDB00DRAFT_867840 [Zychaea mexicana]|uniref:uncharacterized protein n=1 Tax=Zychaea mexicana TaxID=64656 RepID=UPI0022FDF69A|nr:uncharacterized protein BDB00DRAFT_867840 [Zychaea mexicana]KAI9498194.1 hypothetical protein BDB00DRAFT_867840 [Zychaea mexicana]
MDCFDNAPPNVMLALGPPEQRQQKPSSNTATTITTARAACITSSSSNSSSKSSAPFCTNSNHPLLVASSNGSDEQQKTRWTCHKKVLAEHSPYFAAMFDGEFSENGASIVFLPPGVFSAIGLDGVLHYMYTSELMLNVNGSLNKAHTIVQQLQDMYSAADYLGMIQFRQTVSEHLTEYAHQWTCYCGECRDVVTQLFPYSYARAVHCDDELMAIIAEKTLTVLTQEPDKALHTFWTSHGLAEMLTLSQPDVGPYLKQQIIGRISRFNAIETLHACFVANKTFERHEQREQRQRQKSMIITASTTTTTTTTSGEESYEQLKNTVAGALSRSTDIIAHFFDFYCSQYPTLLSCIDGITYSFDFLEFLLQRTLKDNMKPHNAPIMYQGIVRDLMCRHAVQHCAQVKTILTDARRQVLRYIVDNIELVTKSGAFDRLDKNVLAKLAEDTMLHPKAFTLSSAAGAGATHQHHHQHYHYHQFRRPSAASATLKPTSTAEFRGSSVASSHTPSPSEDTGNLRKFLTWLTFVTKISTKRHKHHHQRQQQHQQQKQFIATKKTKLAVASSTNTGAATDSTIHPSNGAADTTAPNNGGSNNNDGSSSAIAKAIIRGMRSPVGKRKILLVRRPLTSP